MYQQIANVHGDINHGSAIVSTRLPNCTLNLQHKPI